MFAISFALGPEDLVGRWLDGHAASDVANEAELLLQRGGRRGNEVECDPGLLPFQLLLRHLLVARMTLEVHRRDGWLPTARRVKLLILLYERSRQFIDRVVLPDCASGHIVCIINFAVIFSHFSCDYNAKFKYQFNIDIFYNCW